VFERADRFREPADLVRVDLFSCEQGDDGVALTEAQVDEQRPGIGVGLARVHRRQRTGGIAPLEAPS